MSRFSDSRLKLDRAEKQVDALKRDLVDAVKSDKQPKWLDLKRDLYKGLPAVTLFVRPDIPMFPIDAGVRIGEIVHNLRSSRPSRSRPTSDLHRPMEVIGCGDRCGVGKERQDQQSRPALLLEF